MQGLRAFDDNQLNEFLTMKINILLNIKTTRHALKKRLKAQKNFNLLDFGENVFMKLKQVSGR